MAVSLTKGQRVSLEKVARIGSFFLLVVLKGNFFNCIAGALRPQHNCIPIISI